MKSIRFLLSVSVLLAVAGCSGIPSANETELPVKAELREGVVLSQFQTFSWMAPTVLRQSDGMVYLGFDKDLKAAIRYALEEKGYLYVDDSELADVVISATIGPRRAIKVTAYPEAYRGPYGWGKMYHGGGLYSPRVHSLQYADETLAVDFFSVAEKQPVWHVIMPNLLALVDRAQLRDELSDIAERLFIPLPGHKR